MIGLQLVIRIVIDHDRSTAGYSVELEFDHDRSAASYLVGLETEIEDKI